ncbi:MULTISPECIES: hypothetical protein [unclassified Stenotrophomonas]|uniref:hypothetical protein n=1 Tax=unclassified Stenotrophomonas TaxID=196198 RepID=UPI002449FD48|nr:MULTISPECIES: hypothetical protein [unclassified Stenotrophomonas]MDH0277284.1 hypothetical protein [Stenotrophomonas sp. GD04089]MDH1911578.1 hypothetical protein [Stenotrophomonas sp. GD03794]
MSIDKTLADAQPGGRVRLGDALPPLPKAGYVTGGDFGHEAHNAFTPEQMRDYALAALSAQPSPGGQDHRMLELARRNIRAYIQIASFPTEADRSAAGLCVDVLEEALAARQPVGEPVSEAFEQLADDVESCVSDACGYLASDSGWDDYGIYRDDAAARYRALPDRIRALAAPPAQAVDLGGLREMLHAWKNSDYPFSYEGQCAQRALDACVADLQGWLDSQAAGK